MKIRSTILITAVFMYAATVSATPPVSETQAPSTLPTAPTLPTTLPTPAPTPIPMPVPTPFPSGSSVGKIPEACQRIKFKKGFIGEVGFGYKFNKLFRTAVVLQHMRTNSNRNSDSSSAKLASYSGMVNGYIDANRDARFTPYLVVGIGIGRNVTKLRSNAASGTSNKTNFVWNAGLGVQGKLNSDITIDLSYRYQDIGKLGKNKLCSGNIKLRKGVHELLVGVAYNFGSTDKHKYNFALLSLGGAKFNN